MNSRKSLMLRCDVQGGLRKREVLLVPRKSKGAEGHLPTLPGTEPIPRWAPRKGHLLGWQKMFQVFLPNYACSTSSPKGTHCSELRLRWSARSSFALAMGRVSREQLVLITTLWDLSLTTSTTSSFVFVA